MARPRKGTRQEDVAKNEALSASLEAAGLSRPTSPLTHQQHEQAEAWVRHLEARVSALEEHVRELRDSVDLDRVLSVKETAAAIGKAPSTLRHWLGDAQLFERHRLGALVRKDPTNHWVSSPRLVARWKQVMFRALQELAR